MPFRLFLFFLALVIPIKAADTDGITPPSIPLDLATNDIQDLSKIRIKLLIASPIDGEADIVRSYMTRELKEIKDVAITDSGELVIINCIVMPLKIGPSGYQNGYGISFAVTSKLNSAVAMKYLQSAKLDDKTYAAVKYLLQDNDKLIDHFVATCARDGLKEELAAGIAKIDGSDLENIRNLFAKK